MPEYLDRVSDDVVELYAAFELSILEDISKRLSKMNYATETIAFQVQQMQESGLIYNNIIKQVARLSGKSEKEVLAAFESSAIKSLAFEDSVYKSAGLSPVPLAQSPAMLQILNANLIKTSGDLLNLTRTTAVSGQQLFMKASSIAQMQVQSGAFTADQAIRSAVKTAANEGLMVRYPTGQKRSVESAVRTNVLTGVNQTASKLTEMRLKELNLNIVETSAHAGAREGEGYKGHINWQGKQFMWEGSSEKYKNFKVSTGYGKVEGLAGANCKHSFYGVPEGAKSAYTKKILDSYDKDDVTFNGKKMSYYEGTQRQRHIETSIRKWKTEAKMMEAAKQDSTQSNMKIRQWQAKAREFAKQTGVKRDYTRERIN